MIENYGQKKIRKLSPIASTRFSALMDFGIINIKSFTRVLDTIDKQEFEFFENTACRHMYPPNQSNHNSSEDQCSALSFSEASKIITKPLKANLVPIYRNEITLIYPRLH